MQHPTRQTPLAPDGGLPFSEQILMRLDEIIGLLDAVAEALVEERLPPPDLSALKDGPPMLGLGGLLFVETDGTGLDGDPVEDMDAWELPY